MSSLTDFMKQIVDGVKHLRTLEVTTVVGPTSWDEEKQRITYDDKAVKVIRTSIDLVQGDITTAFSEDFLSDPYAKLRDFHAEREKRAQEIIDGNIKALKELIDLIIKLATEGTQVKE